MKNKEKVLAALLSSDSQIEAAAKAGIAPRTLRDYLADPDFKAEYQRRKDQLISDATQAIQNGYQAAVVALRRITTDEKAPEAARISAARTLLEYGLRFSELSEVLARITVLEERTNCKP